MVASVPIFAYAGALFQDYAKHVTALEPTSSESSFSPSIGFFANASWAASLYRGCEHSALLSSLHVGLPTDLILIGAQKSGTTSVVAALSALPQIVCTGKDVEFHFFDDASFSARAMNDTDLASYISSWSACADELVPAFSKTPGYSATPWVAKRICEASPQQRLAMFLREPAARAYSSFYNSLTANVSQTPRGFHELATIEVDIVQTCGGLFDGEPAVDAAAAPPFAACCHRVAAAHGQVNWAGCACDMNVHVSPLSPVNCPSVEE